MDNLVKKFKKLERRFCTLRASFGSSSRKGMSPMAVLFESLVAKRSGEVHNSLNGVAESLASTYCGSLDHQRIVGYPPSEDLNRLVALSSSLLLKSAAKQESESAKIDIAAALMAVLARFERRASSMNSSENARLADRVGRLSPLMRSAAASMQEEESCKLLDADELIRTLQAAARHAARAPGSQGIVNTVEFTVAMLNIEEAVVRFVRPGLGRIARWKQLNEMDALLSKFASAGETVVSLLESAKVRQAD